jgi:hypothetical protein
MTSNLPTREETSYLFHNRKPLVAFWGISAGTRESGHIPEIFDIMDFLKTIRFMAGVPFIWEFLRVGEPLDRIQKATRDYTK